MNLADHTPKIAIVEYLPIGGSSTAVGQIAAIFQREVLPHYFAPSTRQAALDNIPHTQHSVEEPELDSPAFEPAALSAFASRGFERKNRWAAGR
jgi:hypothetical protein